MSERYLDDLPALDIRAKSKTMTDFLATMNGVTEGSAFVTIAGFSGQVNYETTRCNYGGLRYWWVCPGCGKKCAVLRVLDSCLACNACTNKPFRSESVTKTDRWADQRESILDRLSRNQHGLYDPLYEFHKPKNMHRRTFIRLASRYNELLNAEAAYMNRICVRAGLPVQFVPA